MLRGAFLFVLALGALTSCNAPTDLNKVCNLPKRCDGGVCFVTEREAQEATTSKIDFIAFGAVDCEDLVCVRDATFPKGTNLDAPAEGYCSKPCVQGSTCRSFQEDMDKDKATRLNCRPLLLDEATLGALCTADPGACANVGGVRSPYFCARGESADAGR